MPQALLDAGFPEARPLRSESEPWGLHPIIDRGMPEEQRQLADANTLWRFTVDLLRAAHARGELWILESPWRSILWFIPGIRARLDLPGSAT